MDNSEYKKLLDDSKAYFYARYDLLRLELLDKMSRIVGMILMALVVVLLVFAAFAFFGLALVFLLSKVVPLSVSCCILGAVFLLVILLAILFKEAWFINPIVKSMAKILFAESSYTATDKENVPAETEKKEDNHE